MTKYEFDDGLVYYSRWDVEICYEDEIVMFTYSMNKEEAEELYDKLNSSSGSTIILQELQYSNPNYTGYLRTIIVKSK